MKSSMALFIAVLLTGLVGCGATTDLILLPFELTGDFTSSTTPGDTAFIGPAKARRQLERFVAYSYDDVHHDIARGNGEYLVSLGELAGVPATSQTAFQAEMQSHYAVMYDAGLPRKESWARVVDTAWSAGHGRTLSGIAPRSTW